MAIEPTIPSSQFAVETELDGARHLLRLSGELDMAQTPLLESCLRTLLTAGASAIVLDLRRLGFIDSAGVRIILVARDLCEQHGCELRLIQGPVQVRRTFEIVGLLDALPFADDAVSRDGDSSRAD